ncbi:hypothetical protein Tco_1228236, partial [Tanacetum coccineum]
MAEVLINALDARNPLFLKNNDHYNVPIIGFKLIGTENYKMLSTAIKIALTGKNKFRFVNVYSQIASKVWEELEETYDQMDGYREFDTLTLLPAYTCDAHEGVLRHNHLLRLLQFLMGLNDVYQNIRSNIFARDLLLDVKEAFNVVSMEESHRGLHPRSGSDFRNKVHPAAFVVKSNNYRGSDFKKGNNNNSSNKGPNSNLLCKNCGLIGHTIERCYEINGYPTEAQNSASTSSGSTNFDTPFTKYQMMKILSLINEKPSGSANANMA